MPAVAFAVTALMALFPVSAWHGYNYSYSRLDDRSTCPSFADATKPYTSSFIDKLSLWPNLMSIFDYENGQTLYGSQEGLELIWKNQNPEDCSKAKYLVSGGWPYGFGSRIHMEGAALGMAMHLGRVYLPHPDGDNFFFETQIEFCRNAKRFEPGMNCFYQAYSKCTIKDATANVGGNVNNLRTYFMGDFRAAFDDEGGLEQMVRTLDGMQGINLVQTYGGGPYELQKFIPHQVRPLIDCSPMREKADYYWWRAVSATYITRPNKETLTVLAQYTNLPIQDFSDAVSMFVRHGDKGIEMKLIDFPVYARIAQMMWDRGLVPLSQRFLQQQSAAAAAATTSSNSTGGTGNRRLRSDISGVRTEGTKMRRILRHRASRHTPDKRSLAQGDLTATTHPGGNHLPFPAQAQKRYLPGVGDGAAPDHNVYGAPVFRATTAAAAAALPPLPFNGTIFLTTEDPQVIAEANAWGAANHWTVVYTNLFDRAKQTAVQTWDEKNRKGTVAVHDKLEYISMLLNLYYSLRSEAYVCTLRSNSCRIIDELRATVGGKANRFYADLSIESCPHPPCLDSTDEIASFGD